MKTKEGSAPAGRDAQVRYINTQVKRFLKRGEPILSIDAKKKERVGAFKNAGRTWRPTGQPHHVNVYDHHPSLAVGSAIPYGAYDVQRNEDFVNVGMSHDTAEFAVESLRRWWRLFGRRRYPRAKALLLCADGGGNNGSRNRAWKYHLQHLADHLGVAITVCHYPPGTSKVEQDYCNLRRPLRPSTRPGAVWGSPRSCSPSSGRGSSGGSSRWCRCCSSWGSCSCSHTRPPSRRSSTRCSDLVMLLDRPEVTILGRFPWRRRRR